jgi:hypothetical protein
VLLFALACSPGKIVLTNADGEPIGDDTGVGDSGDTGDTGPDGDPDYSVWSGEREIQTEDGCFETLYEDGFELESDWEYYDEVVDYCPECQHFYYAEVSPEVVCEVSVANEVIRGVVFDEDSAEVWTFYPGEPRALDSNAAFDGWSIDYDYDLYDGYILIEGRVEFPAL